MDVDMVLEERPQASNDEDNIGAQGVLWPFLLGDVLFD